MAASTPDKYFLDKEFLQKMCYRYRKTNQFAPGTEDIMRQICRSIELHCDCVEDASGRKCHDETCFRRANLIECDLNKCGPACTNNTIAKGLDLKCVCFSSHDDYVKCITALRPIQMGSRIIEYTGRVESGTVAENQFYAFPIKRRDISVDMFVNSAKEGNETRLCHHSMDPNCLIEPWDVDGQIRLVVKAAKDIKKDDVITLCFPQHLGPGVHVDTSEEYYPTVLSLDN